LNGCFKKIAFRADASSQIGTGHFMRCLTLADEFKNKGAKIRFISRNLPAHLIDMLNEKCMEYISLSADVALESVDELAHANWLGTSQAHDAQATIQALADQLWDWLVVDHYGLDERWESAVRVCCKKLMVIDDLADREHNCDVLLDQNYYRDMRTRYNGKVPPNCNLLLGSSYALLREEFRKLREKLKPRSGEVKKILVFFGGFDADNYTSLAISVLEKFYSRLQVVIVIGAQHPNREQIQHACIAYGYTFHEQTTRMAELMAEADLAIGAGGAATWERCCLGLPTLIVAVAENQIDIANALDSEGGCLYLGAKDEVNSQTIQYAIAELLIAPTHVQAISQQASSLVDGLGLSRVSQALGC
jgi:UDP-2,4-diacetamido-2,4,6-trideoxy-beta-L-altropyranose hydrolase